MSDTDTIRTLAGTVRHTAEELREEAAALARRIEAVPWQGCAAEAMRGSVIGQLVRLERAAWRHEDAAVALEEHADRVDQIRQLVPALGVLAVTVAEVL